MTWTSDYGAQRACPKGLRASGSKGLEPIYYSILFTAYEGTKKLRISAVQQQQIATAKVGHLPLAFQALVQSHASVCAICGGWSGTVTGFSPITSVFPCQYHSTIAPYPFIHLPPTLYNVSLPALQFSPVSTIPLSVPFHQCSILIFIYLRQCTCLNLTTDNVV
jgi:hypothetical protein